ncbi:hypothetical protein CSE16_12020 [Solibacillus sp. R5-41]|uniref:hypothetical protein n=1 Tax=Solibacillus sp. R5-41 TaxID=2048654 RepID=UPI000C127D52|nr:hypothetical protein [Solibacillus sp. R5-41]ATP40715.1 hypothetical protein CSE16_12020 [Solibacillus sp. R5-41]
MVNLFLGGDKYAKKRGNKEEVKREEFGTDLSPDDLDIREENDLTEEQYKNSNQVKQSDNNENNK